MENDQTMAIPIHLFDTICIYIMELSVESVALLVI